MSQPFLIKILYCTVWPFHQYNRILSICLCWSLSDSEDFIKYYNHYRIRQRQEKTNAEDAIILVKGLLVHCVIRILTRNAGDINLISQILFYFILF